MSHFKLQTYYTNRPTCLKWFHDISIHVELCIGTIFKCDIKYKSTKNVAWKPNLTVFFNTIMPVSFPIFQADWLQTIENLLQLLGIKIIDSRKF